MGEDIDSMAGEYRRGSERVTDVSAGVCPLGPSKKVKASIRKAVRDIGSYPGPASSRLGRFFKSRFGLAEDAVLFAGSLKELLRVIANSFKPRRIMIVGPSLEICAETLAVSGAEIRLLPSSEESGFAPAIESIRQDPAGIDLLFIANPNRINGSLMKENDLTGMIDAVSKTNTVMVVDESLMEFTTAEGLMGKASKREDLIVLRTTANYHGLPGLELAYAVSAPATIGKLRGKSICPVSVLTCEAARTAYKDKAYFRLVKEFMEKEKLIFERSLKKIDRVTFFGSDSNVFLLKTEYPGNDIRDRLARAGFLVRDCSGIEGLGAEYLRLSVMKHDQNQKLLRVLKERCPTR